MDYITLREYRRVVEAWATPKPPEAVTSWDQTRELAAGASGDITPQVLLEAAREIAQADGRDEVNRDDVREVRGKVTAHDRTLAELFNTALEYLLNVLEARDHPIVRTAKDVAAGGTLAAVIGSVGVGLLLFGPRLWAILRRMG